MNTCSDGVCMVQLYKKQFQWVRGKEYLRKFQLHPGSQLGRFYASCCGTPIGFASPSLQSFPFFVVYLNLITFDEGSANFNELGWRLNIQHVPKDKRAWEDNKGSSTIVVEGVANSFLWTLTKRLVYGLLFRCYDPDPTLNADPEVEYIRP